MSSKKRAKHSVLQSSYTGFFIGVGLFVLAMFFVLGPTKTHLYSVDVPYEDTEYYTEKEPYTYEEAYTVQEPYQTTETYYDEVPVQRTETYTAPEGQYYPSCGTDCVCTNRNWLGSCVECTCLVTDYETVEKERPVTEYMTVTKYRTVNAYKDVQKSRLVTKFRQEQRQYEVNWLFNFRVPWTLHLSR